MGEAEHAARRSLQRSAALFTPLFLLTLAGLVLSLFTSSWLILVVAAILTFLFGYQAIQTLRDLRAEPTSISGEIQRMWARTDFIIVGRSHYVMVQRSIFRVPIERYIELEKGQRVRVSYFPHSHTVIDVEPEGAGQAR